MSNIYLDNNGTTKLLPSVKELMVNLMHAPLNPSSIHAYGRNAKNIIEEARSSILSNLGLNRYDGYSLVFTSSGTEANNLILHNFKEDKILISAIEHPSLLQHREYNKNIITINVLQNGVIDLNDLEEKLKQLQGCKILVSVMNVNNETGIIQPIKEVALLARQYGAYIHSDMVQAIGKINLDIKELDVDFITISSHKFGGPVGAGALIYKEKIHLKPQIIGGGQEKSLRSGTENIIGIAGFAKATANIINMLNAYNNIKALRDYLENQILNICDEAVIIGQDEDRIPNTSLIIMPNVKSQTQLINFDLNGISVSSGSACSSGKVGTSHVLDAMNVDKAFAECAIRVSLSHDQPKSDIESFIKVWSDIYNRLGKQPNKIAV